MRKELLGATVIFGLGTGGLFAQDTVPTDPATDQPGVEAPADTTTGAPAADPLIEEPTTGDPALGAPATDDPAAAGTVDGTAPLDTTGDTTLDTTTTDTGVVTQDAVAEPAPAEPGVVTNTRDGQPVDEVADTHLLASEIIGASIVQMDGTSIGSISDAVMSADGYTMDHVIVDVGGFLGIGTKTAAIPVEELGLPDQDGYIQVSLTREQIEALPDFVGRPAPQTEVMPGDPMTDPMADPMAPAP